MIVAMNVYTFALFFIDKRRARKNKHRISEKQLLLSSFAVGGIGAMLGMTKFRHKTQKPVFKIAVPIAGAITIIAFIAVLVWL
jgi:uncharacterized membrane protein YsdA (DUF1294 family)